MRIICLSAESADICARLGAWRDVVAVTAYAPKEGLEQRPVIGGFSIADADRIASFAPDLVITFSDVQASITAELVREGLTVLATNQRTLNEIAKTIVLIGGAIGRYQEAEILSAQFLNELETIRVNSDFRPRIYFEEWHEPLVSGIEWVSEIIELTGGHDIFIGRRSKAARDRIVTSQEVITANPEIIIASWCGRPLDKRVITGRPGFVEVTAVREAEIHEVKSDLILQPGPRLLEGARQIQKIIETWHGRERSSRNQLWY